MWKCRVRTAESGGLRCLTLEGDIGDFGQLTELWSSWNQNLLGCFRHKTRLVTMATGRQQIAMTVGLVMLYHLNSRVASYKSLVLLLLMLPLLLLLLP